MKRILEEIKSERARQNEKWGEQNHKPIEWIAILSEEVGEASKESVDHHFKNLDCYKRTPSEAYQILRLKEYRKELIQTAAVAVQMVESLDRNELKKA